MNKNIINFIKKAKALPVLNSNITSISKIPLLCTCPFLSKGKREKRTKMQSILLGLKKGWETPTLPDNLLKLQLHPFIRIIRFLGGSSFLLILSKNYLNYNVYALYICMFFATIFTIYHIILTFYRIKHTIKLFKNKELDVRNSPLDRLASLTVKALVCLKNGCEVAQPIGLMLGLLLGTDEILKAADRQTIFAPFLGNIINIVLPDNVLQDSSKLINNDIKELETKNEIINPKFLGNIDFYGLINDIFHLTGNSALDLLTLIIFFKKMELLFMYILIYNLIIISIDTKIIESSIVNRYPKITNYICIFINYTKKSSKVVIICSILLLVFSNFYSYYSINFLVDNFDNIVEYYIKNKN